VRYSSSQALASQLRSAGVSDVLDDDTSRAAYSSDASLYRLIPQAVVRPRSSDELRATLEVARGTDTSVTCRGAGTSVAGNAVGAGIVVDFSRHMNRVLDMDAEQRTARVEPGTIHATLQRQAQQFGLRFGPDPSTHTRCTIGGMIGNNACGSRTLGYGRTSDNIAALTFLLADGREMSTGYDATGRPTVTGSDDLLLALKATIGRHLHSARTELGQFGRQVSGYAAHALLPENGCDLQSLMIGSEGTLGIVTEATVRLVAEPRHNRMVVLGFPTIAEAGDAAPSVLAFRPTACEGIDSRIVDVLRRRRGPGSHPALIPGAAWLLVEVAGDDEAEVRERSELLAGSTGAVSSLVVSNPTDAAALWRIREDGAGLAGRAPSGDPAYGGWEDAAVPPHALGRYLRDFDALVLSYGLTSMPYGHFGDGCVHVRLDFPFHRTDGRTILRRFLFDAADLVASYGGSLSGEHGDGRARSELLPRMYSPDALALFREVKDAFDPARTLNPGVLVDAAPVDVDVRALDLSRVDRGLAFAYADDSGDFSMAVHRCSGVGKCRSDSSAIDVMCPSFKATRNEKDSTRGRARVLQEMVRGDRPDWRSHAVWDALDLCLSCKGCASDCPTGIDMAAYKAEVTHQRYRRRLRPLSHYSVGWLPRWARFASPLNRIANAVTGRSVARRTALYLGGLDTRRSIPQLANTTARRSLSARPLLAEPEGRPVLLFLDSLTNYFSPQIALAAVSVLEKAGYFVQIAERQTCCGLTWISTGQLDAARRMLAQTVEALAPVARAGTPIVGLEPSCTAVLRHEALNLVGTDAARDVAAVTVTLAELLARDKAWTPPVLTGSTIIAQPHCHHQAVMGWADDAALLASTGAEVRRLGGCCGLAGNFGVERGHYDVSVAVASQQLLPAIEGAKPTALILADGFSCRSQVQDLTDREAVHLAELLAIKLSNP